MKHLTAPILLRRLLPALLLLATCAAARADLTLAVSEGTSGGSRNVGFNTYLKYQVLADQISKATGQQVQVVAVPKFSDLAEGAQSHRYAFIFARPSNYPAEAVLHNGYHFVATAKPEGQCWIVVRKDSPLKTVKDAVGKRWALPKKVSYMSQFCHAALRDQGVALQGQHVDFLDSQGAVLSALDLNLADVGAVASYATGIGEWLQSSGRILFRSKQQPYFPLVAGPGISDAQIRDLQRRLLGLQDTADGRAGLKRMGIDGFDTQTGDRPKALPGWLNGS